MLLFEKGQFAGSSLNFDQRWRNGSKSEFKKCAEDLFRMYIPLERKVLYLVETSPPATLPLTLSAVLIS